LPDPDFVFRGSGLGEILARPTGDDRSVFKRGPTDKKDAPCGHGCDRTSGRNGYGILGTPHAKAIGDLAFIAFYYLLRVGEYTVKGKCNNTKQIVQFKFKDVSFFRQNKAGTLVCLP
jgi:hypothetical protein